MKNGESKVNKIKELIEKGKSKGTLTYKEIMDMLEEIDLQPEQIEKVYETLESFGIDVIDEVEEEAPDKDVSVFPRA
jgi:RNA polymerase primary sigma factor